MSKRFIDKINNKWEDYEYVENVIFSTLLQLPEISRSVYNSYYYKGESYKSLMRNYGFVNENSVDEFINKILGEIKESLKQRGIEQIEVSDIHKLSDHFGKANRINKIDPLDFIEEDEEHEYKYELNKDEAKRYNNIEDPSEEERLIFLILMAISGSRFTRPFLMGYRNAEENKDTENQDATEYLEDILPHIINGEPLIIESKDGLRSVFQYSKEKQSAYIQADYEIKISSNEEYGTYEDDESYKLTMEEVKRMFESDAPLVLKFEEKE